MAKGWIKLHRQLLDNIDLMHDDKAFMLFTILLLKANPKGQALISMRGLAKELRWDHTTLFRATQRLQKYEITQRSTQHRKTLITICNWSKYQSTTQQQTQQPRNTGATVTQRPPLSVRNENNNKERDLILDKKEAQARGYSQSGEGYKSAVAIADMIKRKKQAQ